MMPQSVYKRPLGKPQRLAVKSRREFTDVTPITITKPLIVHASTECHITPEAVADRMFSYFEHSHDAIIDPQCGTGALIAAILDSGFDGEVIGVERNYELANFSKNRFEVENVKIINDCFFDYCEESKLEITGAICNPPFKKVRSHMKALLAFLKISKCTEVIALVPSTYTQPQGWIMEQIESLPFDTFPTCKVNTQIIRLSLI